MKSYSKCVLFISIAVLWAVIAHGENISEEIQETSKDAALELMNEYQVVSETVRFVTAYNVGDPRQCWGDPCISANGENICAALDLGMRRCAANFVPLGTELFIQEYGICVVTDRTNRRYRNRVDIAMKLNEYWKAKKFGKQRLFVKILKKYNLANRESGY